MAKACAVVSSLNLTIFYAMAGEAKIVLLLTLLTELLHVSIEMYSYTSSLLRNRGVGMGVAGHCYIIQHLDDADPQCNSFCDEARS